IYRVSNFRNSGLQTKQRLRINDPVTRAHRLHLVNQISRTARAVATRSIPERDQSEIRVAALLIARFSQRIEEHPEIIALPDTVVWFRAQPRGDVIFVALR